MKIFKFGGASVKDAAGVKNVASILAKYSTGQVLVVISAMGKMTNKFEELVDAYYHNAENTQKILSEIKAFHYKLIQDLDQGQNVNLSNDVDNLLLELECLLENPNQLTDFDFIYDQVVCFGELLSTKIVSNYLIGKNARNQWIDARNFIVTNSRFRDGKIDWEKTEPLIANRLKPIAEKSLLITQGFIARDTKNATTTLGREGSDYSAAIFAYCLNAESVTIWKDVAGVMNADPKKFDFATLIPELTYNDTIELAYYGASVIHPKTIQPLKAKHIPLHVKSFIHTEDAGTVVKENASGLQSACYIHKPDQMMVELSSKDFTFIVEDTLKEIFSILATSKIRCNIMQNSAISFSFVSDYFPSRVEMLRNAFENCGLQVQIREKLELLTVYNGVAARVDAITNNKKILMEQRTGNTIHYLLS